jgi:hypothetical protein
MQFSSKDPNMLRVLAYHFSSAILPLVEKFYSTLKGTKYEKYATTNVNIFYDYARYICKNYLFYVPNDQKRKKKNFTDREFASLMKNNYSYVFEPKVIRKKFIEFCSNDEGRALNDAPMKKEMMRKLRRFGVDPVASSKELITFVKILIILNKYTF